MGKAPLNIDLEEGVPLRVEVGRLDESVAKAIFRSQQFDFEFPNFANDFCYVIVSKNVVGHIPIGRDCVVRVTPKTPVVNLFRMLEVAYDLKSFRLLDGVVKVESIADLYERLASILSKRVLARVRKGLYQDYVEQRADLGYVRGRLDSLKTAQLLTQGNVVVRCEYQENTADLEDNQILLWTLRIIGGLSLSRPDVRFQVQRTYRALSHTVSLVPATAAICRDRRYNRLNEDYQSMHGICRFFLEHQGPGAMVGESTMIPFVVNMPRLFEAFVAEWLRENMPRQYHVRAQHVAKLKATEPLSFKIDIVIRDALSGRPLAVLDTKYKIGETSRETDIQQVVAYAVEMEVDRAFLIYPSSTVRQHAVQVGHVHVESIAFDIGQNYENAGQVFRSVLLTKLSE